jgi:hypothetical protein
MSYQILIYLIESNLIFRVLDICQNISNADLYAAIDAEQTTIQSSIRSLNVQLQTIFN